MLYCVLFGVISHHRNTNISITLTHSSQITITVVHTGKLVNNNRECEQKDDVALLNICVKNAAAKMEEQLMRC